MKSKHKLTNKLFIEHEHGTMQELLIEFFIKTNI